MMIIQEQNQETLNLANIQGESPDVGVTDSFSPSHSATGARVIAVVLDLALATLIYHYSVL